MARPRTHPGKSPNLPKLYELAETQAGYFTTAQADACGYSRPLLHHHVRANRFERTAHGIYRLVQFPASDHEDLVVTWLWSGREGVYSHESALALHELSDALPAVKHLTVPTSWKRRRLQVPAGTFLHFADVARDATSWRGSVPVTSPLRTVTDCIQDHADPVLVRQAVKQGLERGLFSADEVTACVSAVGQDPREVLPRRRRAAMR